jgi:LytS/YehU family sensor histidine kinase
MVLLFVFLQYSVEYLFFRWHNVEPGIYSFFKSSGSSFLLEFLASYFVDCIAILGAGMIVLLKYWLIKGKQKSLLEKVHMQTEVEKLKEQVNPEFLFTILHKMGDVTIDDQQRASDMLLELSELLRYQLYDSNREKVLINAEINFITNYLRIEKLYYQKMDFTISKTGDVQRVLVPPLFFLPLVQYAVKDFQEKGDSFCMNIHFRSTADFISFSCNCYSTELLESTDFDKVKQRLYTLYKDRYQLKVISGQEDGQPALYLQIDI